MSSVIRIGKKIERVSFDNLSITELIEEFLKKRELYKQAKVNFEFEYAPLLYQEINEIIKEMNIRGIA